MPLETVRADWMGDRRFVLRDRGGYPVFMTQPDGVNGADLLPMSLIGCALWDVVAILQKQRQQVATAHALAESSRDDEAPWRYRAIHIHYRVGGHNIDPVRVEQAIRLTEDKYCSIYATLRDAVMIRSDFEIADEGDYEEHVPLAPLEDAVTQLTRSVIHDFNAAFNRHDVDAIMVLSTADCVFENTQPPPDGERFEGVPAVRQFWESFFAGSPQAVFEWEDVVAMGERAIVRWRYHWRGADGTPGQIRGVDVFRLRDGRISEKLSYVKG